MSRLISAALLAGALYSLAMPANAEPLTLEQAIQRASEEAPRLQARNAAVEAARAGRVQAGVRPNPTVTVTGENLAGSGRYDVLSQSEITSSYAQTLERGGKREARTVLAERDIGVASAAARVARLDLAAQVERAYYDVIIADEIAWVADYRLRTERQMQTEALRRVRGYKDPLFVETRAAARVAQADIFVREAKRRQVSARNALASFWGGTGDGLEITGGVLTDITRPMVIAPSDEAYEEARVARAQAAVTLEQTRSVQDYTVSGGVRYLRGTGDVALVTGVTIPIGRFDRNRGNIERAQAERRRLEFEAEADRLERLRRLASLRADADAAMLRADAIRAEVMPRTVRTLEQVREGYRRGGFTFRDVQDAADAIIEVQEQWIAAANSWRDLQTEIDRLSGRFDAPAPEETDQ